MTPRRRKLRNGWIMCIRTRCLGRGDFAPNYPSAARLFSDDDGGGRADSGATRSKKTALSAGGRPAILEEKRDGGYAVSPAFRRGRTFRSAISPLAEVGDGGQLHRPCLVSRDLFAPFSSGPFSLSGSGQRLPHRGTRIGAFDGVFEERGLSREVGAATGVSVSGRGFQRRMFPRVCLRRATMADDGDFGASRSGGRGATFPPSFKIVSVRVARVLWRLINSASAAFPHPQGRG